MYVPDNLDFWHEEDRRRQLEQSQWHTCTGCGEPIAPGHGWEDNGEYFCEGDCLTEYVLDNVNIDDLAEYYAKHEWKMEKL